MLQHPQLACHIVDELILDGQFALGGSDRSEGALEDIERVSHFRRYDVDREDQAMLPHRESTVPTLGDVLPVPLEDRGVLRPPARLFDNTAESWAK